MRHAAGAICRPNCMQFAYILSLPYKKCDYIISFRIASHCSRRVIPQLTESAMGNARKLPCVPLSLPISFSVLLFHLFWHFSENKHQNIFNFGRVSPSISFSLDPHSRHGDRQRKFFTLSSLRACLSSHISRFSKFLRCFFPSRHLHFSSFWVIYDSPWRAGARSLVIYSIIFDSFLLCCDISRLFLNRNTRKWFIYLSYMPPIGKGVAVAECLPCSYRAL